MISQPIIGKYIHKLHVLLYRELWKSIVTGKDYKKSNFPAD